MKAESMLWRRLDKPGHEAARLTFQGSCWHLAGTAAFAHSNKPCRLDYLVICDLEWHTLSGTVSGWVGDETVEVEISVDSNHQWLLNGKEYPEVDGSIDLDLAFSPSTNLLPIRRLGLAVGEEAEVKAAHKLAERRDDLRSPFGERAGDRREHREWREPHHVIGDLEHDVHQFFHGFQQAFGRAVLQLAQRDAEDRQEEHQPGLGGRHREAAIAGLTIRFVLAVWEGYFGRTIPWHFARDFDRLEVVMLPALHNAIVGYGFMEVGSHENDDGTVVPFALNFDVIAHELTQPGGAAMRFVAAMAAC